MTKVILGSLLAGGLLLAQTPAQTEAQMATQSNPKLSGFEREALATQSPRVHTKTHKHGTKPADHIAKDKHTINAFIPYGK